MPRQKERSPLNARPARSRPAERFQPGTRSEGDWVEAVTRRASSVAEVQSVSIASTTVSTTSSGSGLDTLRLYLSDESTDPMMTSPVMVLPLQLVAGSTDTTHVDISGDQRVADLFMGQRLRMALTTSYRGPSSGSDLNGVISVVQIDAVVIAGRKPY